MPCFSQRSASSVPRSYALRFLARCMFALIAIAPTATHAMLINQVRPWTGNTGVGDTLVAVVELYNDTTGTQNTTGWYLAGVTSSDVIALPGFNVPPGDYMNVVFGPGMDDPDFSDGVGTFYTGNTSYGFVSYQGEVGLYYGLPSSSTIQDFVNWGLDGGSFGFSYGNAIAAGMWPVGGFVDLNGISLLAEIARLPSGYDRDLTTDWAELEMPYAAPLTLHHALQLAPRDGTLQTSQPTFTWRSVHDASSYTLDVDTDPAFPAPVISTTVLTTSYTPPSALADGGYYWRVTPNGLAGGPYPRAVYSFALTSTPPGPGPLRAQANFGLTAVPPYLQHKDSRMLCIWNTNAGGVPFRPGCTEAASAQGPWDAAHPATMAHIPGCRHCNQYCTRASIQMVNAKFQGTLLQDEISYKLWAGATPGPEGDLGHGIGALPSANSAYSWALNNATVTEKFIAPDAPIPYDSLKSEVDRGHPVITVIRPPGWFHTVVFNGYFSFFGFQFEYITDPWPGRTGWYDQRRMPCVRYYMIRPAALTGRATDPKVSTDTDGDGVVDFDEGNPRGFQSSMNSVDTDKDQVNDKEEIRQYTFHRNYHVTHIDNTLGFPDIDGDGLRAENDCDSDNDGQFDGGEDINGNGHFDAGETCPLSAASKNLALAVATAADACPYLEAKPTMSGGKLHANSVYTVDVQLADCQPPAPNSPLGAGGSIATNGAGDINMSSFLCYPPGTYRMIVDAIANGKYDAGCDPIVCFTIDRVVATDAVNNFLAAMDPDGVRVSWWLMDRAIYNGFRVYRSIAGEGEEMLTPQPISSDATRYPAQFVYHDKSAEGGRQYAYRIEALKPAGGSSWYGPVTLQTSIVPRVFALRGMLPNPFSKLTQVAFDLPLGAGETRLQVFDIAGRHVRDLFRGRLVPSEQRVTWDGRDEDGSDLAAGVYLVRLETALGVRTARVVKVR